VTDSIAPAPGAGRLRSPDVLAASAALALMASLPFLNPVHLFPLPTFFEESLALGLGLIALACIAFSRQPGPTAIPVISIWTLALALVFLLQPLWSGTPYAEPATIAGLYVLWAAAVMWVGAQMRLADVERISLLLATALLLGAMVGAAVAWIQMLGLASQVGTWIPALQNGRAPGVLAQVNLHANHLVVGSASLVFLWTERRISSAAALLCGVLLAGGIAFAASRAALLELAWLLFASFWLRRRGPREPGARAFWVGVLAFALILAVCAATAMGFESRGVSDRVTRIGEGSQYMVRLSIYEAAIRTWLSAPLGGVGVGGFAWAHYTTATPWVGDVPMNSEPYAHNIVLQLLAETGLIGAGICGAAIVLWFAANARRTIGASVVWRSWAIGIVGVQLVHSLFEFPLWHAEFLGITALLMGICEHRTYRMGSQVLSRALALGAAAMGAVLLSTAIRNHRQLMDWGVTPQAFTPAGRASQEQALRGLRRSLLAPYVDVGLAATLPVSRDGLPEKVAFMGRAVQFWPVALFVQKQIRLLAMAGNDDEALALLAHLARLQPQQIAGLNAELEAIPGADIPDDSPVRRRVRQLVEARKRERSP
jgi:O-antigen ligase